MRGTGRPLAARLAAPVALALLWAQVPTAGAQTLQHDSSLPIEITADTLEVVQNERVATFTGNVDAVQGELVLSADQLRVHYRSGEQEEPAVAGDGGTIRRIEAVGNVFLTSPMETAQGEVGVYDVMGNLVTLEGSVVLTREENVIRGARLELDLASGRSRVLAAVPSAEGGEPSERVRAIFTPASGSGTGAGPSASAEGSAGGGNPGSALRPPPGPNPASAE